MYPLQYCSDMLVPTFRLFLGQCALILSIKLYCAVRFVFWLRWKPRFNNCKTYIITYCIYYDILCPYSVGVLCFQRDNLAVPLVNITALLGNTSHCRGEHYSVIIPNNQRDQRGGTILQLYLTIREIRGGHYSSITTNNQGDQRGALFCN